MTNYQLCGARAALLYAGWQQTGEVWGDTYNTYPHQPYPGLIPWRGCKGVYLGFMELAREGVLRRAGAVAVRACNFVRLTRKADRGDLIDLCRFAGDEMTDHHQWSFRPTN